MFACHVDEFDYHVVEYLVTFEFQVGFDAFVVSVPYVDGSVDAVAANVFYVWVAHERVDFAEADEVAFSVV